MPTYNDYGVTRSSYEELTAQFSDDVKERGKLEEISTDKDAQIHATSTDVVFPMEDMTTYNVQMFVNVQGPQMISCKVKARDMLNLYTTIHTAWDNFIRHMETTAYFMMSKDNDMNMDYYNGYSTVRNTEPLMLILTNPDYVQGDAIAVSSGHVQENIANDFQAYLDRVSPSEEGNAVSSTVLSDEEE